MWIFFVQVGDLGYADELGNYAEYSGAPNEEETLNYARSLIDVRIGTLQCIFPGAVLLVAVKSSLFGSFSCDALKKLRLS
jgi:hypothetical protein